MYRGFKILSCDVSNNGKYSFFLDTDTTPTKDVDDRDKSFKFIAIYLFLVEQILMDC